MTEYFAELFYIAKARLIEMVFSLWFPYESTNHTWNHRLIIGFG